MNSNLVKTITVAGILLIGVVIGWVLKPSTSQVEHASSHEYKEAVSDQIYTCSMHPQIRQNEPGLCPICEMDLIPLEANTSNDPLILQMTEEAVKLANIQTTIAGGGLGLGEKTIQLSGKVQTDERLASSQVAHVPGRIEKLYVTFTGEQVQKGQKLATLYSPDLITAQQELLEAVKMKSTHPGLLEAARNKLRYWKIKEDVIAAVEQKGVVEETFDLYANESGIVTNRRVALGDYVKKGEPLFELVNLDRVWVIFDAYESDLANISVGDKIGFTVPSLSDKSFQASVTYVDPSINPMTRSVAVRTEVANSRGLLKPEMFVNGKLQSKQKRKGKLTVPKTAILWTGQRSVVYVKVPDVEIPSFEYREVELGESTGSDYLITSGLELGEEIVVNGSFTIDAAAQLNNQASMMNRAVLVKKEGEDVKPDYKDDTPKAFKHQLENLVVAYLSLKDAFVATDPAAAVESSKAVLSKLKEVDMSLLKGEAHLYWMEQMNAIQSHVEKLGEMNDVEEQRKQFGFLSNALINAVEAFGVENQTLYIQYCPMAMDDKGADWIATEEAIQNPYFGDKMMKCGTVKKELGVPKIN